MQSFTVYGRGDFDEITGLMSVDVATYAKNKSKEPYVLQKVQTLLLPQEQAIELVRTMTPTRGAMLDALDKNIAARASGDGFTHWNQPRELLPCLRWLKLLANTLVAHLGHVTCKYMTIRIDMRGGNFVVLDDVGNRAEDKLRDMIVRYTDRTPSLCNPDDQIPGLDNGSNLQRQGREYPRSF